MQSLSSSLYSLLALLLVASGHTSGQAAVSPADHQLVDSLFDAAEAHYQASDYAQSLGLMVQILPLVQQEGFTAEDRASCYNLAALDYMRLGDLENAISYAEQTLFIDQAEGSPEDISSSINVLAGIYLTADQPESALKYCLESIDVERPLGRPNALAIRLGMASEIYVKLGRNEEARQTADEALQLVLPLGDRNSIGIREAQLAATYAALGDAAKAETLLVEAIDHLRASHNPNSLAITLSQHGALCLSQGRTAQAAACYAESSSISQATGNKLVESKACQQMAQILRPTDPATAIDYLERYATLSQQLYTEQSAQALACHEVRHQVAAYERQMERMQDQLHVRQVWLVVLGLLLVAAVVTIVLMRRITRLRTQRDHMLVRSNIMGISELGVLPDIHFTRRELEVVKLCAQGLMAKEIADRMGISERTVEVHKSHIFRKLGIQTTVELVIYARQAGIVTVTSV